MTPASPNHKKADTELIGGLVVDGALRRDFAFGPVDGQLELAIAENGTQRQSVPERVTAVLTQALDQLGGRSPTEAVVWQLCVGDRQFLVRQMAALVGRDRVWLTAACRHCGADFDICVVQTELPVKPAGEGFPLAIVPTSLGPLRFQVPRGAHQEAIVGIREEREARRELIRQCLADGHSGSEVSDTDAAPDVDALSEADLREIETALDELSPQVALTAQARCPECREECLVELDPYLTLQMGHSGIFKEIHVLASAYHWSERDILVLSRERRHTYLQLVDRSRGMFS